MSVLVQALDVGFETDLDDKWEAQLHERNGIQSRKWCE